MPTELKIRRVRSVTISGVRAGPHGEGRLARVLTVRSEDGHIYNITLVGERAEWLDVEENGAKRARRGGDAGKDARGAYAGGLNNLKKLPVVASASESASMPLSRASSSAT